MQKTCHDVEVQWFKGKLELLRSAGNTQVFQKGFWEKSDVEVGLFLIQIS